MTDHQAGSPEVRQGSHGPVEGGADLENQQSRGVMTRGGGKEAPSLKFSPYDLPVGKMKKISMLVFDLVKNY